ncbi:hypothetical protein MmiHf6_04460 [Methanimicrococcus hongohii]|uniref:Uncharacterized protein n=1 Tax=Methanimicrococcus hongohii TaxID=3028295 RepID=A0AA96UZU2_9EURY|nr:hypothetical protein [Methanimicrococcus sp. Hf6]WNY23143.1 hypothetical protein MmiHf6_04460 [Methanimicrococcus sp. Hf6]
MDYALTLDQIVFLLAAAAVLLIIQYYLGRKGKQKESFLLIAVPFVISILFSIYAFFFMDFPEGNRFLVILTYFIRINIITIMLAALHSVYFGRRVPANQKRR